MPGRSTGAAPVTTMTGSVPPARSSATPRLASVWPPSSTSAFGCPSRLPSPAASKTPAMVAGIRSAGPRAGLELVQRLPVRGELVGLVLAGHPVVVDPAGGLGQWPARAAPAQLDQLGRDGDRGFLRRPGAEVEADRRAQPGQLGLGHADLAQPN